MIYLIPILVLAAIAWQFRRRPIQPPHPLCGCRECRDWRGRVFVAAELERLNPN